ncbi:hypothetical protein CPC08DRAFT_646503, partial [Agrocybe pediades]
PTSTPRVLFPIYTAPSPSHPRLSTLSLITPSLITLISQYPIDPLNVYAHWPCPCPMSCSCRTLAVALNAKLIGRKGRSIPSGRRPNVVI